MRCGEPPGRGRERSHERSPRSSARLPRFRRALGYKLERDGHELGRFIDTLNARRIETITVDVALAWATRSPRGPSCHPKRLLAIRGFARYLESIGVPVEVPPSDLLPERRCRAVPYLYADEEIVRLIDEAGTLRTPHRAATFRTLIDVLAATAMRRGEAIALDREDFDAITGVVVIRAGKFGKSRELPLHPSTEIAISDHLRRPDRPRTVDPRDRS
jgi:integrase